MAMARPGARGQTLSRRLNFVELLVTFAIVAVVTVVAAGLLKATLDRARDARRGAEHGTITTAEDIHFTLYGRYATVAELIEGDLLARAPAGLDVEVLDGGASYRIVEAPRPSPEPPPPQPSPPQPAPGTGGGTPAAGPDGLSPPGGYARSG